MDIWKSAREAAERAAVVARSVSQKGLTYAEEAAGEASRKLKELNLYDKVSERVSSNAQREISEDQLKYFGLTESFREYVQELEAEAIRRFPDADLVELREGHKASVASELNAWQVQHAVLICQVVPKVSEMRYTLCPRQMTDEHFWHVYFSLTRQHLPDVAYTWSPGDKLPIWKSEAAASQLSISTIGSQLKQFGSRIHDTAAAASSGMELATFPSLNGLRRFQGEDKPSSDTAHVKAVGMLPGDKEVAPEAPRVVKGSVEPTPVLEADPDLEAYLQVAIAEREENPAHSNDSPDDEEDDVDFDSYLNELSAEVEAQEAAGGSESKSEKVDGD